MDFAEEFDVECKFGETRLCGIGPISKNLILREYQVPREIPYLWLVVDAASRETVSANNREKYRENLIFCGKMAASLHEPHILCGFQRI